MVKVKQVKSEDGLPDDPDLNVTGQKRRNSAKILSKKRISKGMITLLMQDVRKV